MSAHTPGPWFRDQHGHVYGWKPTENGKASVLLIDNRHSEATSADKNLIAAAPELLNALQELVAEWDTRNAAEDHRSGYTLGTAGIAMARAAIAKATGGEA